jgi:hypothetical protein
MKELTVFAPNRPGQLAAITEALAAAGINVEDLDVEAFGEEGLVALTVDNCNAALRALRDAGFHAVTQETILIRLEDKPGALAAVAARLRDAGLDLRSMHIIRRDGAVSITSLVSNDQARAARVLADLLVR